MTKVLIPFFFEEDIIIQKLSDIHCHVLSQDWILAIVFEFEYGRGKYFIFLIQVSEPKGDVFAGCIRRF